MKFIYNDIEKAKKVLVDLENELNESLEFIFSVAFISESGITCLLQTLKELEEKGIKGKILTTDYLYFNTPKVLDKLNEFNNIELRIFEVKNYVPFHTKAYIFRKKDKYSIIMGSSNITANALTYNKEWNNLEEYKFDDAYFNEILDEFYNMWSKASPYTDIKEKYKLEYDKEKLNTYLVDNKNTIKVKNDFFIKPNAMQRVFLEKFEYYYNISDRALFISATGTGKTYAISLAIKNINAKRILFLVHREQIAKKSLEVFKLIFGSTKKMSMYSGNESDIEADFLFATIQTMSKDKNLNRFGKEYFTEIIIDEAHRAGAKTYLKVIDYFKPKFYLGMTATPDRTDNFNLYKLFSYNIVYELRLKDALKEGLLCPFHYFGISELRLGDRYIDEFSDFSLLIDERRVEHIIENAKYYGYSGSRVKGLIFCRSIEEADSLSFEFNKRGFRTKSLSAKDSIINREKYIERLVSDEDLDTNLDYIFTVDIFNEGIDIPDINQIILLRPTKSAIVFMQQLGRGLRKTLNKEYVVILDFIANYENNFMIPLALSTKDSLDKDDMRNFIVHANLKLFGNSSIHFDYIARQKIYESIDKIRLDTYLEISKFYDILKNKINKIPSYMDFEEYSALDIARIFMCSSSYQKFLIRKENIYVDKFSNSMLENFEFISRELILSKKIEELLILKILIEENKEISNFEMIDLILARAGFQVKSLDLLISKKILTNTYVTSKITAKKYKNSIFLDKNSNNFVLNKDFINNLEDDIFNKEIIKLIEYGIYRYKKRYLYNLYKDTKFVLYERYTYSDICKLFSWKINYVPLAIGGYKYDEETKTLPVFINYEVEENALNSKYTHGFISSGKFVSMSKPNRNLESKEIKNFYKEDTKIYLFMRKNKKDKENSVYFYFLGQMSLDKVSLVEAKEDIKFVKFEFNLEVAVRDDLYDYFINIDR